jgi:hypothetical protein
MAHSDPNPKERQQKHAKDTKKTNPSVNPPFVFFVFFC